MTQAALASLSFWIPPDRVGEFQAAYEKELLPQLQSYGMVEAEELARPVPPGVFSRLFALQSPAEVAPRRAFLRTHPPWQEALRSVGRTFRAAEPLRSHWGIYRSPAGRGRTVAAGRGIRRGAWHSFGVPDGLPCSVIVALYRDRHANLWLCTWMGGACRYDGANFTTYTTADGLAHDMVFATTEDRAGRLWFGTTEGATCYDGREFRTYTTASGLAHNMVSAIVEDRDGRLWFGTDDGVSCHDGTHFRTYTTLDGLPHAPVHAIAEDREGNLWFAGVGPQARVTQFDGKRFRTFTKADGLGADSVRAISADPSGALWFATVGGLSQYAGGRFTNYTMEHGLSHDMLGALLWDSNRRLWAGTHLGGVNCYDGRSFRAFTYQDGLNCNTVTALAEDAAGHIWCGTWGGGMSRYDGHYLATFTSKDGLASDAVTFLLEDRRGRLWCGTFEGVSCYDGSGFTSLRRADGLVGDDVWSIAEDADGYLWFGTHQSSANSGLSRYDGEAFASYTVDDGLPAAAVTCLRVDRQGRLWIGTGGGLSRYDGKDLRNVAIGQDLPQPGVRCMLHDRDGILWVGGGGGVWRVDGDTCTPFTPADGLAHEQVECIVQDRDANLWFGTAGGLSRYDGKGFTTFRTADGLAHDHVTCLLQDRQGYLWVGTWGRGVSRYDGKVFQSLSRQDGLAHDTVRHLLQDRRGDIWIATEGGLTRYRPQAMPPTIHLTDVVAEGRRGPICQVEVPVSSNPLVFEFQGRSWTTRPDRMRYLHRLCGHQDEWQVTDQQRAEYQNLPVGEYCFQVRAVDRDLNESPEAALVQLSVIPDPVVDGLKSALSQSGGHQEFVGISRALHEVQRQLVQVVDTDMALLIRGETGTGKGLAARLVHSASRRKSGPFVTVSCGALPERLVESELYGHEKGAFTGAHSRKLGKAELAQGGTLFLDEIGDLPLEAQGKLLRLLEEYTFERVGGTRSLCADVRVVAATNRDLEQMVAEGLFRQDLYFRLKVFEVRLPPLRQRREDIPLLALYFMGRMAAHLGKRMSHVSREALALLQQYDWPGNVRELQHVVERAVVVSGGPVVQAVDIVLEVGASPPVQTGQWVSMNEMERRYIQRVLEQTMGVIAGPRGACAILCLPESTLRYRIRKLGIQIQRP
ncbi:MAG: two-component regulator propeller domain-containing protein [Candidatus Latescibacterota bacterium]